MSIIDLDAIYNHSKRQIESDQFAVTRISSKALMQLIDGLRMCLSVLEEYRGNEDIDKVRANVRDVLKAPGSKD